MTLPVPSPNPPPPSRLAPFLDAIHALGPALAARAVRHDVEGSFVAAGYAELARAGLFAAAVPAELGGGGLSHPQTGEMLRVLARYCPATALTLSMHQHLVAAAVYRHRRGQPGEALLRRVADGAVLVSTGGRDWLESTGRATRVPGGYRVSARKAFASGAEAGDIVVTSARFDDPDEGPLVLHFSVPAGAAGVRLEDDWDAMGMRGSGSRTVVFDEVFVPDEAIALRRARGVWHPVWGVVLVVAMPLIVAVYLGAAEAAVEKAERHALERMGSRMDMHGDVSAFYLLGELGNLLTTAQLAARDMMAVANDYDFEPTVANANAILIRKTIATNALVATSEKALELAGGVGFYRGFGLERLLRDVHAAQFHPLPEKQQHLFSGRVALGLEPVAASGGDAPPARRAPAGVAP